MQEIPAHVLEYLSSRDSMVKAQIAGEHPELQQQLSDPSTRAAILKWLGSEAAWEPTALGLLLNCLRFLQGGTVEEAAIVRPFVLHADPFVRIAAFEFLLALYYPNKNPEALLLIFQNMLSDQNDKVRSLAAHYIETISVGGEMKEFLERWYKNAKNLGWGGTESVERIGRILGK
jgi:hypothetical protein